MVDVKELKELEEFAILAVKGALKAYEDGAFNVTDVVHLAPAVMALAPAISGVDKVAEEVKDLSVAEVVELVEHAVSKFPEIPPKAALIVKQSALVAVELAKLYQVVKA